MVDGTPWKHFLRFALPVLVGSLLQQLYNTIDSIVVGNFLGEDALSYVPVCIQHKVLRMVGGAVCRQFICGTKNKVFDTDEFFTGLKRDILLMLLSVASLPERAERAEKYLLKRLDLNHKNSNIMNAVSDIF